MRKKEKKKEKEKTEKNKKKGGKNGFINQNEKKKTRDKIRKNIRFEGTHRETSRQSSKAAVNPTHAAAGAAEAKKVKNSFRRAGHSALGGASENGTWNRVSSPPLSPPRSPAEEKAPLSPPEQPRNGGPPEGSVGKEESTAIASPEVVMGEGKLGWS